MNKTERNFCLGKKAFLGSTLAFLATSLFACGEDNKSSTVFEVLIENLRTELQESASDGTRYSFALGPTVWAVHENSSPFYTIGQVAPSNGLESFAEDANVNSLIEGVRVIDNTKLVGLVTSDTQEQSENVLAPGETFRFLVAAQEGDKLSFAIPYLQANDVIVGTPDSGIDLFDANGTPINGEISSRLNFFDIGTEVNQEPGIGSNQLLRQEADNTGASESNPMAIVSDGFTYPSAGSALKVSINVVGSAD